MAVTLFDPGPPIISEDGNPLNPDDNGVWYVYFGPGYADVDAEMTGGFVEDSTPTYHLGVGVKADAGSTYIRPDFKLREIDDCEEDCTHFELSLSVGFKF